MNKPRKQRVLLISRNSGTCFWRCSQPLQFLRDIGVCDLEWLQPDDVPLRDRVFLESYDTFVFHQVWTDLMWQLATMLKSLGKRIVCSCDDLIVGHQIPKFNKGGVPYNDPIIMRNVHDFFNLADKVVVTTPTLAQQLSQFYEVPQSKFLVFPNLPSHDWLGRWFNAKQKTQMFQQAQRKGGKFRVGVISSLSHYNMDVSTWKQGNQTQPDDQPDDLQIVLDMLTEMGKGNHKDIQIVMPINENKALRDRFPDTVEVEMRPMTPIRQYPTMLANMNLQAVIVPLQDNNFSNCKSDIKSTETAALGIPTLFSDTIPYKHCVPDWHRCKTPSEFAQRLISIRSWSDRRYQDTIQQNYQRTFESDVDYFGQHINGYWLEKNLEIVGDAFLKFSPETNADGIVPPPINLKEGQS